MKINYLLPNRLKLFAWIVFIPSVILGVLWTVEAITIEPEVLNFKVFALFNDDFSSNEGFWIKNNLLNEILGIGIVVSGLILGFSKTKMEDEYIAQLRSEALVWSTYINYGFLLLALLFVYGFSFLTFMLFGLFLSLILFVLIFHYKIYLLNNKTRSEE